MNQQTVDMLTEMKMTAMAAEFANQIQDASFNSIGFEERLSNAACRRMKTVRYIRMPELLDELNIARSNGSLKKLMKAYKKVELLILDEWLIRPLYDLLEIAESRSSRSTIFCTQYQPEGWYTGIDPDPESQSPISEAIMDQIIHNSYEIMVEGRVSMRERKGLRAASLKNDKTDA